MLLNLLNDALPGGSILPKNLYEMKKIIRELGLSYDKIHACPNDCMLYWRESANLEISRAKLFKITHTMSDGKPINDFAATILEKIDEIESSQTDDGSSSSFPSREDTLGKAFGEEKRGRVRGLGLGPTPTSLWGKRSGLAYASQIEQQNQELRQKMEDLHKEFDDKLKRMELLLEARNGGSNSIRSPNEINSSAASHHVDLSPEDDDDFPVLDINDGANLNNTNQIINPMNKMTNAVDERRHTKSSYMQGPKAHKITSHGMMEQGSTRLYGDSISVDTNRFFERFKHSHILLNHLPLDLRLAISFFDWTGSLPGFRHDHGSHSALLGLLVRHRLFAAVRRIRISMFRSCDAGDVVGALEGEEGLGLGEVGDGDTIADGRDELGVVGVL
ncbi:hypothetical protein QJS10_CPB15g00603 [Acorus calamus]|uniref:Uncharacterized protein n=1 Tax=Acorus calamus TaxID=4465 RepID=A0AAV9D6U3_ACOCL|nr:hypothetical protein QJS10_CPB15g00603 [Acorus calamus]